MVMTMSAACTLSVVGLGKFAGDIQADLSHSLHHGRVQLACRLRPGRADPHAARCLVIEQRRRHLRPPGVVRADEQHARDVSDAHASRFRRREERLFSGSLGAQAGIQRPDRSDGDRGARELRADEGGRGRGGMPAKVSVNIRPRVIAGLAKLVEEVKK